MAQIETLNVTVKYKVGLGGITLPKRVLEQLEKACDDGKTLDIGGGNNAGYELAAEWIQNNISEKDGYDWEAEVEEVTLPD